MRTVVLRGSLSALALVVTLTAQELPPLEVVPVSEQLPIEYAVQLPAGFAAEQFRPVVVLCGEVTLHAEADRRRALAQASGLLAKGMVVVVPQFAALPVRGVGVSCVPLPPPGIERLPAAIRRRFHIAGGGMHLVGIGNGCRTAGALAEAASWQFGSLTVVDGKHTVLPDSALRLWDRQCTLFGAEPEQRGELERMFPRGGITIRAAVADERLPAALVERLAELQAARTQAGPAGEVGLALDDFHDAADKGDLERYFGRFPDDAVFLGTDPEERWVGKEFRSFAAPYFRRGSAWTFVPVRRHVDVAAGGRLAWFDERLDNEAYGECRGSGVLELRDGRWVVRQYDLTIPVPNLLAKGQVARNRMFARGLPAPLSTVVIVRHAEKAAGDDPDLSEAGRARAARLVTALADVPIGYVFTSQYRRAQGTAAPLCTAHNLTPKVVPAADTKALCAELGRLGPHSTVLVVGHSDTIPALLQALGVEEKLTIADDDFGELLVVERSSDGTRLLRLHY